MATIGGYNLPDELYYHAKHTWVRLEGAQVRIGMTDFYGKMAGETTYIDLPFEGDETTQGAVIGKLQSVKWVGNLEAPLSGEILEVNSALEDDCSTINSDPYDAGWILVLNPSNLEAELPKLYHGATVEPWITKEIEDNKPTA